MIIATGKLRDHPLPKIFSVGRFVKLRISIQEIGSHAFLHAFRVLLENPLLRQVFANIKGMVCVCKIQYRNELRSTQQESPIGEAI